MKSIAKLVSILALLIVVFASCQLDMEYSEAGYVYESTDLRNAGETDHVVGGVWISPKQKTKSLGNDFKTKLMANTGDQLLGAISVQVTFNPQVIQPNQAIGDKGVTSDEFVFPEKGGFAVNIIPITPTQSMLFIGGFRAWGVPPGAEVVLFELNWTAVGIGETEVMPNVGTLVTIQIEILGTPTGYPGTVIIH